jgi:hypothetical protein
MRVDEYGFSGITLFGTLVNRGWGPSEELGSGYFARLMALLQYAAVRVLSARYRCRFTNRTEVLDGVVPDLLCS